MYNIEYGKIKIPQFQRYFVWDMKKSAKLLDSIIKGYPIGTFITWHTDERLHAVRNIGNIDLPEPKDNEYVDFVLDGQQRITSIFAALKGEKIEHKNGKMEDFSDIVVDLDAGSDDDIVTTKYSMAEQHTSIPLTDLLDDDDVFERITEFDKAYYKRLGDYRRRMLSYNYSVIEVSKATLYVAAEIFTRTNVGGKPLDTFQIMVAKTYDHEQKFDLAEKFDGLVERLREVGYETLPNTTALFLISLVLKGECRRKTILSLQKDDVIREWGRVVDAILHAVDYLRSYYRIPVSKLLPYDKLVVILAYFFYKNNCNKPNTTQEKYLADLFWRASLSGRYSGPTETNIAQDVGSVNQILKNKLPTYDWPVDISPGYIRRSGTFKVGGSFSKAILCIYAYHEPKSFKSNAKVNLDNSWLKQTNSKNYHHFFPKSYLKGKRIEQDINSVLNITIVDDYLNKQEIRNRAPSDYMGEFKNENVHLSQTMKTHLIHDLDKFGVWDDDYDKFLDMRAKAVSEAINERLIKNPNDASNTNEPGKSASGTPLHKAKYVQGMKRPMSLIRPDKQVSITSWTEILVGVVDYLVDNGHLGRSHCPVPIGGKNSLLHVEPIHQNGKRFRHHKTVGGLYLNTNLSPHNVLRHAIRLIKLTQVNPEDFRLILD